MEINFFKKLYIQFAVDIPYVLLFVFIYDYQFNINIVSKNLLMKMSMDVYSMSDFYPQRMNLIQNAFQLTYKSTKYFKGLNLMNSQYIWELGKSCKTH